jgi:dCMP deaminase
LKQLLLYLPVIHSGYEALFARHADAGGVLLLGTGFRAEFPVLAKDIRALAPSRAAEYLRFALPGSQVAVVEPPDLPGAVTGDPLVLPDEQVTRELAERYQLARGRTVVFDRSFLRWDRDWSRATRPANFDGEIAVGDLPRGLIARAQRLADRSSDWWRQVGAIAVRGDDLLGFAWNQHHPTEYSPYLDGDPRNEFSRGVRADLTTAIHAEAAIIARAASNGDVLRGADLYVTTFPCPSCARLIAEAGFARCFFAGPYSVLDGDTILRAAAVELLWVNTGSEESRTEGAGGDGAGGDGAGGDGAGGDGAGGDGAGGAHASS